MDVNSSSVLGWSVIFLAIVCAIVILFIHAARETRYDVFYSMKKVNPLLSETVNNLLKYQIIMKIDVDPVIQHILYKYSVVNKINVDDTLTIYLEIKERWFSAIKKRMDNDKW